MRSACPPDRCLTRHRDGYKFTQNGANARRSALRTRKARTSRKERPLDRSSEKHRHTQYPAVEALRPPRPQPCAKHAMEAFH